MVGMWLLYSQQILCQVCQNIWFMMLVGYIVKKILWSISVFWKLEVCQRNGCVVVDYVDGHFYARNVVLAVHITT